MPPVTQQSSRAGLITWLVIFTVLFLTATVIAIYYGVETTRLQEELSDTRNKIIPKIVPSLTSDTIATLEQDKAQNANKYPDSMGLLDVAVTQRNDLATLITGTPGTTVAQAEAAVAGTLDAAKRQTQGADVTLPASAGLTTAIRDLAAAVQTRAGRVVELQKQVEDIQKEKAQIIQRTDAALKQKDEQIAQARQQADAARGETASYSQTKNQSIQQMETDREKERQVAQEAINAKDVELTKARNDLTAAQKRIDALQTRLGGLRVNPNEAMIRQPDGRIVRVGGQNVVYIDKGAGDQIAPGMTFEVYDRGAGVPGLGDGLADQNLPEGKAAIEVIRVGPTSSEARIVRLRPGAMLTEGDIIANLVYDPHTKYNFVVFGKFDLDHNGVATAQDSEVIKRLITQWGGKVSDAADVNVNTDFVVLGQEPTIPQFSADEEKDPLVQQKIAAARKDLEEYQTVRRTASELNIPIMNQNRFLYFVGYYDLAAR